MEESIAPYQRFWSELSVQEGCLLGGNRIVVPPEVTLGTSWKLEDEVTDTFICLVAWN